MRKKKALKSKAKKVYKKEKRLRVKRSGAIRMLQTREAFMVIGAAFIGAGITHLLMANNFPLSVIMFGLGFMLVVLWA